MIKTQYDVVIVGGGMVGATLACALNASSATHNLSVLIVDAQPQSDASNAAPHPSFDSRSTALSAASRGILERIGLWQSVQSSACPIEAIQVSDKGRLGSTKLAREDYGVPALGYVVENAAFGAALSAQLKAAEHSELLAPARVTAATPVDGGMRVAVEGEGGDTREVTAKLLVVAEGGRSPLCAQLGIARSQHDYGQHALIANVGLTQPHNGVAYERFTATGPLAMLPLIAADSAQRSSLVWTLDASEAQDAAAMDDAALLERLQQAFGWRLGRLGRIGARAIYPLSLQVAQEQVRPHLVLLGNVAHTLHPVAGQGMNLSLRDIEALVETLATPTLELGSMTMLTRYSQAREADQNLMIGVTDGLTKLFSSDAQAKVWLRKAGLLSLDLIPALKTRFGARAMGFE